jgi:hypothetical protein
MLNKPVKTNPMKKTITILSLAITTLTANATTYVVNNRTDLPVNPGQYTTIQAAITAASAGDTILVAGSATAYTGQINVNKKLTIIGPGYNPDKQNPLKAIIGQIIINSGNASGSTIMGLITNLMLNSTTTDNNITIRRCELSGFMVGDSTFNLLFTENMMKGQFYWSTGKGQKNCRITNNVFLLDQMFYGIYQNTLPSNNITPVIVDHNLFISGNSNTPLISTNWREAFYSNINANFVRNFIMTNNIFYNVNPSQPNTFGNFTFNNNISFSGGTLPTLPSPGSVGSGNINNVDPQFVSIFNTGNTVDYNLDNLRLKSTSPAHNAATDGTDIGPTGGTYPIYQSTNRVLTGEPIVPEIKFMNFVGASATQPGGTLQINVKAKKIN